MADRLSVHCPCCGNVMTVDASTGDVLAEQRPRGSQKSFEEAFGEVQTGEQRRHDAFAKAFDRTKRLDDVLEKKFEEARKKAKDEPGRPFNPLDLD